jgi:YfiH family protein
MPHGRSRVTLIRDGRVVAFPGWLEVSGLIHGATVRGVVPEADPFDLFGAVQAMRAAGVLPDCPTMGGDQVHGDQVGILSVPIAFGGHPAGFRWNQALRVGQYAATDALISSIPGVLLCIRTADCLPVLFMDRPTKLVGAAHCGWKGTLAGLAGKTARLMLEMGARPARLEAWIGPGIRPAAYAVGADVMKAFLARYPKEVVTPDGVHLDLPALCRWQLEEAGIIPEHVFDCEECSWSNAERYASYRRDGQEAGRMLAFVGFGPEAAA